MVHSRGSQAPRWCRDRGLGAAGGRAWLDENRRGDAAGGILALDGALLRRRGGGHRRMRRHRRQVRRRRRSGAVHPRLRRQRPRGGRDCGRAGPPRADRQRRLRRLDSRRCRCPHWQVLRGQHRRRRCPRLHCAGRHGQCGRAADRSRQGWGDPDQRRGGFCRRPRDDAARTPDARATRKGQEPRRVGGRRSEAGSPRGGRTSGDTRVCGGPADGAATVVSRSGWGTGG